MTKLSKISLSNVRRFSENVEIEVTTGATIILAPNGTGKTSIFEAIELALTGRVGRLGHPPTPIIRDKNTSAKIRLDFDKEKFCEAYFEKGKEPTITSNHFQLFDGVSPDNIPYLLKLTHLLNQSNRDWIVQTQGEAAGNQLDSLALGKDALQANGVLLSLKRAANIILDKIQKEYQEVSNVLLNWESLIKRRQSESTTSNKPSLSKEDILSNLKSILEEHQVSNHNLDSRFNIPQLKLLLDQAGLLVSERLKHIYDQINELGTLEFTVDNYQEVNSRLINEQTNLTVKQLVIQGREKLIDDLNKSVLNAKTNLLAKEEKIKELEEQFKEIQKIDEKTISLNKLEISLLNIEENRNKLLQNLNETEKQYLNEAQLRSKQNQLEQRLQSIVKDKYELNSLNAKLADWLKAESLIKEISLVIKPKIEGTFKQQQLEVNLAAANQRQAENFYQQQRAHLKSLISNTDKIKQAVVDIITQLSHEAESCPVCGADYSAIELRSRAQNSLNSLDAALIPANAEAEKSLNDLRKVSAYLNECTNALSNTTVELKRVDNESEERSEHIQVNILPYFAPATTLADAEVFHFNRIKSLEELEAFTEQEISNLHPIVEFDFLNLNEALSVQRINYQNLEQKVSLIQQTISSLQNDISAMQTQTVSPASRSFVQEQLVELKSTWESESKTLSISLDSHEKETSLLSSEKSQLLVLEKYIQSLEERLFSLLSQWQRLIPDIPDKQMLLEQLADLQNLSKNLVSQQSIITNLLIEVAKWESYEQHYEVEREIKEFIGEFSEEEHAKKLQTEEVSKRTELQLVEKKISAIRKFSTHLSSEIESINKAIESINPSWSKLLKRIIVDPRFSQTTLHSYQYYKKNYADVVVTLHDEKIQIANVASEAQITDVQLSFLLTMAKAYQWSSWKGLLLDDPTQHHDLVHASAVFDLLRDYIVNDGFQVILATHDTVQAKFFHRKLENDGIPCNFYNLIATANGVTAQMI